MLVQRLAAASYSQAADSFNFSPRLHWKPCPSVPPGTQVRTGWSEELLSARGDIVQVIVNDRPNSVRLLNTPSGHKEEGINSALYVQDSWRLGRVTLNPGVRYERFVMSIPAQGAPAGT